MKTKYSFDRLARSKVFWALVAEVVILIVSVILRHDFLKIEINKTTGMFYGVLTGAFIAAYTVVDGYAVKVLLMSPILVDYMGNLLRIVMLLPLGMRNWPETCSLWRVQWRHAALVAFFSPIAYVLVLYAVQSAPISHVAPAREVSMLFAALIGGRLLGEGDRALRIAGAVLIALGVTALGLG